MEVSVQDKIKETRRTFIDPGAFFVSWQGAMTLVFTGFPEPLRELKAFLNLISGVAEENFGSRWPKITLGCLKESITLEEDQFKKLTALAQEYGQRLQESGWRMPVDALRVVVLGNRQLSKRLIDYEIKLTNPVDETGPIEEELLRIDPFLKQGILEGEAFLKELRGVNVPGGRQSRSEEDHVETSLVCQAKDLPPAVNEFKQAVDKLLPNYYVWFPEESLQGWENPEMGSINEKVACLEPRWAPFSGFSVLFDNPSPSLETVGTGLQKIHCDLFKNTDLQLYQGLHQFFSNQDPYVFIGNYRLFLLPCASYHVTVWDGLNDSNAKDLPEKWHGPLKELLGGLPNSWCANNVFATSIARSELVSHKAWAITFKFDKLSLWGEQVLVARLKPADSGSEQHLKQLREARGKLSEDFKEEFGIKLSSRYHPHVSLGYFGNKKCIKRAESDLDNWTKGLQEELAGATITFQSTSLYAFTDMATFIK